MVAQDPTNAAAAFLQSQKILLHARFLQALAKQRKLQRRIKSRIVASTNTLPPSFLHAHHGNAFCFQLGAYKLYAVLRTLAMRNAFFRLKVTPTQPCALGDCQSRADTIQHLHVFCMSPTTSLFFFAWQDIVTRWRAHDDALLRTAYLAACRSRAAQLSVLALLRTRRRLMKHYMKR